MFYSECPYFGGLCFPADGGCKKAADEGRCELCTETSNETKEVEMEVEKKDNN